MPQRRRIVPDNSVMMPAFFREELIFRGNPFDLTRRAKPLADAILARKVDTFAPDFLVHEFMKETLEKARPREGSPALELEMVQRQVEAFQSLRITYVPSYRLMVRAWELALQGGLSMADAWYVACALEYDAELWLSHEHSDGLAAYAAEVHPGGVHLLVNERFA